MLNDFFISVGSKKNTCGFVWTKTLISYHKNHYQVNRFYNTLTVSVVPG